MMLDIFTLKLIKNWIHQNPLANELFNADFNVAMRFLQECPW